MKRILLVVSMAVAIAAWWAVPASAGSPKVCAPAADNAPGQGADNNQAPSPTQRATLPNNDGTQNAKGESPAIKSFCGVQG
jgi:hypothetical protein